MLEKYQQYDHSFKVVIIEDSGVVKTCLTSNGVKELYPIIRKSTVVLEFFNFTIIPNDSIVKLNNMRYMRTRGS